MHQELVLMQRSSVEAAELMQRQHEQQLRRRLNASVPDLSWLRSSDE
jgi:hypothetical protein